MSDTLATKQDLNELKGHLDARFAQIDTRFAGIDARFEYLEKHFDAGLEKRIDRDKRAHGPAFAVKMTPSTGLRSTVSVAMVAGPR